MNNTKRIWEEFRIETNVVKDILLKFRNEIRSNTNVDEYSELLNQIEKEIDKIKTKKFIDCVDCGKEREVITSTTAGPYHYIQKCPHCNAKLYSVHAWELWRTPKKA